jgi:cytochrome bd-type quinol oxidase subunit 2
MKNPTLRPIIKGFIWGIVISIIFILFRLMMLPMRRATVGSSDVDLTVLWIISVVIFLLSTLIGLVVSYAKSKNPWVLIFIFLIVIAVISGLLWLLSNYLPIAHF